MKVKKIIACVTTLSILSPCVITAFAASDSDGINTARQMALENSTITSDAVEYTPFSYEGFEVRLYKEPLLDANEAIEKYPNAYNYISERAQEIGISTSPDSSDFQEYAISFALYEGTDRGLTKEIQDFAGFMDLYENISKNENILATVSSRSASNAELESLMPISDSGTESSGNIPSLVELEELKLLDRIETYANGYSSSAARTYASTWWDQTNNDDYPYYAEYNGYSTTTNDYNDLEDGVPGQSATRRGWQDCTNFVSQCLVAGGMGTRKSGILLPHMDNKNWYYTDSKPSNSWGAASNFYEHWRKRAGVASSSADLTIGDAVSMDFEQDGDINHTAIIVQNRGTGDSGKELAQHTSERFRELANGDPYSLEYCYDRGFYLYGYEMDKAPIE